MILVDTHFACYRQFYRARLRLQCDIILHQFVTTLLYEITKDNTNTDEIANKEQGISVEL